MAKTATHTIQQWGDSLAVREVGPEVQVTTDDFGVTIEPIGPRELTLDQKLALFDRAEHGGETMATGPVGVEVF